MVFSERLARLTKVVQQLNALVSDVEDLAAGQGRLLDMIEALDREFHDFRADLRAFKTEVKAEALQNAQDTVIRVQQGFHDRLRDLAIRIDRLEQGGRGNAAGDGDGHSLPPIDHGR